MIDDGKFGKYGGIFVPELLIPALEELETGFMKYKDDKDFNVLNDASRLYDYFTGNR